MKNTNAIVFGANEYALQIVKQLQNVCKYVQLYVLKEEEYMLHKENGLNVEFFDLSDNWDDLALKFNLDESLIFCALNDDAENIFLTISLRASFESARIIALSRDSESANKLKMAGASKVIPMIQTTANVILDILEKPIITNVLHKILYEEGDLKMAEIVISPDATVIGKNVSDIIWQEEHKLIVLAYLTQEYETHFIYTSQNHHILQANDILVVIGYQKDITALQQKIGGEHEKDWRHWSW